MFVETPDIKVESVLLCRVIFVKGSAAAYEESITIPFISLSEPEKELFAFAATFMIAKSINKYLNIIIPF